MLCVLSNDASQDGRTALHMACRSGQDDVVLMLLNAGAAVNALTKVYCLVFVPLFFRLSVHPSILTFTFSSSNFDYVLCVRE